MIELRFPCPVVPPPSINEMPQSRGGRMGWSRKRKSWAETVQAYAADIPELVEGLGPTIVGMALPFETRRTRDPHNYTGSVVKWTIDALVKFGVWPDDNPDWVTTVEPTFVIPEYYVTVTLTPREEPT